MFPQLENGDDNNHIVLIVKWGKDLKTLVNQKCSEKASITHSLCFCNDQTRTWPIPCSPLVPSLIISSLFLQVSRDQGHHVAFSFFTFFRCSQSDKNRVVEKWDSQPKHLDGNLSTVLLLTATWFWASYLTSLGFLLLICKNEINSPCNIF